jgi:hypothetical protein
LFVSGKSQKFLVVINPIGGSGSARQTFEKKVHPLFVLAGVELVVKSKGIYIILVVQYISV